MEKITNLKTIQDIELSALQFIDTVCRKHGIRYFLAGGTLLGAVRHQGFIPWDNDVDLAMPRKDYEEFIRVVEQEYTDTPYRIARITDDNDYFYGYAKLYDSRTIMYEHSYSNAMDWLGTFIDLFPLDGFGDDPKFAKTLFYQARHTIRRICISRTMVGAKTLKEKCGRIHHYLRYTLLQGRGRSMAQLSHRLQQYDFDSSAYIASTCGIRGEKEILPQQLFSNTCKKAFEGLMLPAPIGWHEYLTAMYGNYMQLPPEAERIAPHDVTVYVKEGVEL